MGFKETQSRITHSVRSLIQRGRAAARHKSDRPDRGSQSGTDNPTPPPNPDAGN